MSNLPNRLAGEASPYLRLHAHNPVDWFAWGEEAFSKAEREQKPIFLSIGYFTCHWCHVMERESFADPAIADQLNRDFVSIKVDREERPDVDRLYMAYVQAATGSGGWPLSAFLTPERKPFFGGTYYPPRDRPGYPGFARVLASLAQSWRAEPERIRAGAAQAGNTLAEMLLPPAAAPTGLPSAADVWQNLYSALDASFDAAEGGFGGPPKFPRPATLHFLLRYHHRHPQTAAGQQALAMTVQTLRAMQQGGIHDQIGGGFHRYATDSSWLVPHFEKMLYDQAQLVTAFIEAWRITHSADLATAAASTLDFVLREMRDPAGGYYSAQDADSPIPQSLKFLSPAEEVGEGAYYLWTMAEVADLLGRPAAESFAWRYGLEPNGNVPKRLDPQGEFAGKNIPHQIADRLGSSTTEVEADLKVSQQKLYAARRLRLPPPTDDKVLSAWNGLWLSALAQAAAVFERADYLAAAQTLARFLEAKMYDPTERTLYRRWRGGERAIPGFVEDYAFVIQGLLDLYEADFDPHWHEWAHELQQRQDELFAAPEGGYYSGPQESELWLRLREEYDGAEPSPNSISASNLLRFGTAAGREQALRLLTSLSHRLLRQPEGLPILAAALARAEAPPRSIVITGEPDDAAAQALLHVVRQRFLPEHSLWLAGGRDWRRRPEPLENISFQGKTEALVCEHFVCQLPAENPITLAMQLP